MKNLITIILISFTFQLLGQTVDKPILITVKPISTTVAPNGQSAVVIDFKIPKGIWLGAQNKAARTPPATVIYPVSNDKFTFGTPLFPEPYTEGVPAKIGVTKVYKEALRVVIPFTVAANVPDGDYPINFNITYTPGYNAGRLTTHNKEMYSTTISISKNAIQQAVIPAPKNGEVSDDFIVAAKEYDVSPIFRFMFTPLKEETFLTNSLHSIWLDPKNHGKTVRLMPFPYAYSSNFEGSSVGMGLTLFNSTREGTMTGMFAMFGYSNEYIGGAFGVQAISCPAAYHNYQFFAFVGGENYHFISLHYENLTIGKTENFGIELTANSLNEPRKRFYGLGATTRESDETVYREEELEGILDAYFLPAQSIRVGLGLRYRDIDTGTSISDLSDEGLPFLVQENRFVDLLGLNGGSVLGTRFNLIYDHRDQEFSPSRGFYGKTTFEYNNFLDDETFPEIADNYWTINLDMRQYFSTANQRLVFLIRNSWTFNSEENIPFFEGASLGGVNTMRAYDPDRFIGKNSLFASMEMRVTLFDVKVLGYPLAVEMAGFVDAGQVFGGGHELGDELNVDPGVSIRMINRPNVGMIFNIASGEDGVYFSGGIGLPF